MWQRQLHKGRCSSAALQAKTVGLFLIGAAEIVRQYLLGATARRTTYVHIIRGSVYRKCAAYDKTDSLAVRAPRRHSRLHAVTLTEPPRFDLTSHTRSSWPQRENFERDDGGESTGKNENTGNGEHPETLNLMIDRSREEVATAMNSILWTSNDRKGRAVAPRIPRAPPLSNKEIAKALTTEINEQGLWDSDADRRVPEHASRDSRSKLSAEYSTRKIPMIGRSAVRLQDCFNPLDKIVTAFGQRVFRCPAPLYFIGLSSATLSYFTYSVVFLHNTKYPTTRPHRRTNPPHHAPAGTKHPLHPLPQPLIPHIQCCLTSVRDKLGCESSGSRVPFLVRKK
ncbi:hypothetical protein ALC60_07755 [Trachymyrmex zeteki]|uniref:Uncharacterized protein n=1 Tax=Mycetomoellerius zeteki TaxID=64791 RepID=A0A151WYR5_9HYME|nr:hypothetical protein ALC60_07755 [Trachymyrmex zeteki]